MRKYVLLIISVIIIFTVLGCESEPVELLDFSVEMVDELLVDNTKDMVIVTDQDEGRVVVYDLSNYNSGDLVDSYEVWSFDPKNSTTVSGVKFRENTVLGDVILVVSSGGYAGIVTYPEKKVLWETSDAGNNPHSIEILPDGNIVCASSNGSTVRLYHTFDLQYDGYVSTGDYIDYTLEDAHGVLWDPQYNVLWALGAYELVSYTVEGMGMDLTLKRTDNSYSLPTYWGHDLVADLNDSNHLWITTGEKMYRFNKQTGKFDSEFAESHILNHNDIKGFGNNRNGNYFCVYPNSGTPEATKEMYSWCSDRFYFIRIENEEFVLNSLLSETCAYYKVRTFYGMYQ